MQQALLMRGAPYTDPYWAYVKTLLHFDGGVTDSSTLGLTYTLSGGAVVSATSPLYGSGKLDCTSSTGDRLNGTGLFGAGTGDLCIEGWFNDPNGTGNQYVFLYEGVTSQTIRVYSPGIGQIAADVSGGGPGGIDAYSYNTWTHFAITRSGNNWTFWLQGVAAKTWVNATYNAGATATIWIGSGSGLTSGLQCSLDEFRITIGVPRYTAPFTPSGPFPNS
jgi:hypothetical protein